MHENKHYIIKFPDQTYLVKHNTFNCENHFKDHASHYDNIIAVRFSNKIVAMLIAKVVGGEVVDTNKVLRYELGKCYEMINGKPFDVCKVHNDLVGYECVSNAEGKHRYNRSTSMWDNGRITGSKWTEECLKYPPVIYYKK